MFTFGDLNHSSSIDHLNFPRYTPRHRVASKRSGNHAFKKLSREDELMAQYGILRDYRLADAAEDIRGSKLYGLNDEKLGKIDDVIFDYSTGSIGYVVIDTGGWLSTKKFVVPADRLQVSGQHKDDFAVDLNKQQVEGFPPYNESDLESDEQWGDYEGRYRSQWKAEPVMHRFAAGTGSVEISQSAMGIGPRWDTFQNRLRERRKEVITTGSTEESADKYRKAS